MIKVYVAGGRNDEQARLREHRARQVVDVTRGEFDQLAKVFRERIEALEKAAAKEKQ